MNSVYQNTNAPKITPSARVNAPDFTYGSFILYLINHTPRVRYSHTILTMPGLHFPDETWMNVAGNLRDRKTQAELRYLWNSVRLVSRTFKESVEKIFEEEHLPKTWLHYNLSKSLSPHSPLKLAAMNRAPKQSGNWSHTQSSIYGI